MEKALERRLKNYNWNEWKTFRLPTITTKKDTSNIVSNHEEYVVILKAYDRQIDWLEQKESEENRELLKQSQLDNLIKEKEIFMNTYSQFTRGM